MLDKDRVTWDGDLSGHIFMWSEYVFDQRLQSARIHVMHPLVNFKGLSIMQYTTLYEDHIRVLPSHVVRLTFKCYNRSAWIVQLPLVISWTPRPLHLSVPPSVLPFVCEVWRNTCPAALACWARWWSWCGHAPAGDGRMTNASHSRI